MESAPCSDATVARYDARCLYSMHLIRTFEERCEILAKGGRIRGSMHLCTGQEAVATGICEVMRDRDYLAYTYRSHGWALARGLSPTAVFAECLGRSAGCLGGRVGSKHVGDWSRRTLPGNAIVGATAALGAGLALASKFRSEPDVAVAVFGEGATNQGVLHEALTMAALWCLPVVFICEDNRYTELTPADAVLPVAKVVDRAVAYGMNAATCDGMDVRAVMAAGGTAIARARDGKGPTFLVAETYRYCGHMTGDPQGYRTESEVESWRQRDCIDRLRTQMQHDGVAAHVIAQIELDAAATVSEAEGEAWASPEPAPESIWKLAPSWTLPGSRFHGSNR